MVEESFKVELFRFRVYPRAPLFHKPAHEVLISKLESCIQDTPKPYCESGKTVWRVGQVSKLDDRGAFLEFGKIAPSESEYYDKEDEKYIETSGDKVRHTLIYINFKDQLVGIIPDSNLAQRTDTIAKKFEYAIQKKCEDIEIEIFPVRDPTEFIEKLRKAYSVTSFSVSYGKPNENLSPDPIYKTITEVTEATGSDETTMTAKSKDGIEEREQREQVENIVRDANATGYGVEAKIRQSKGEKPQTIRPNGDRASIPIPSKEKDDHNGIVRKITSFWKNFKNGKDQ